jgi:hypothetical protein
MNPKATPQVVAALMDLNAQDEQVNFVPVETSGFL